MNDALTPRESAVLVAMIERADAFDEPVAAGDRRRWLDQVAGTRRVGRCSCGTCPSIELGDANGNRPGLDGSRIVLSAGSEGALLLLFVDDDRLSYLELAPTQENGSFGEFPAVDQITF